MSAMIEDDIQVEQIQAHVIPTPLCDEDDEPAHSSEAEESPDNASAEDVEAHGGGGFNEQK